jgi:hypothetical protein
MKFLTLQQDRRQKGMALILAIGFLALLSILGAVVMRVSTQDMKASGAVVPKQKAFYVADRAVEYALNRDMIYYLNPMAGTPTANLVTGTVTSGLTHKQIIETGELNISMESGTVEDLGESGLPPYLASIHGSDFGANLYHVKVKTMAYKGNPTLEASAHVDAAIVRLYKKDDDQIFRTSGGG